MIGQNVDTHHPGNIQQYAAGDDRRVAVAATLGPDHRAEMLVLGPAVPLHAPIAHVIEGVDVRAAMGVHRDRVARVAVLLVDVAAVAGSAMGDLTFRRMGHPDAERRITGLRPGRHRRVVDNVEVEHLAAVHSGHDVGDRFRRDPV